MTNLMTKLVIIVNGGEIIWFYPNSPARVELILKGCQEVYDSSRAQRFLDWVLSKI